MNAEAPSVGRECAAVIVLGGHKMGDENVLKFQRWGVRFEGLFSEIWREGRQAGRQFTFHITPPPKQIFYLLPFPIHPAGQ